MDSIITQRTLWQPMGGDFLEDMIKDLEKENEFVLWYENIPEKDKIRLKDGRRCTHFLYVLSFLDIKKYKA